MCIRCDATVATAEHSTSNEEQDDTHIYDYPAVLGVPGVIELTPCPAYNVVTQTDDLTPCPASGAPIVRVPAEASGDV